MAASYPMIKKYILENIDNGTYVNGQMLPPEREFTKLFQVSRMTVRRAFDELIQDGILIRKKGSGVIVAPLKESRAFNKISFQTDSALIEKYGKITTKVLSLKVVKNHPLAKKYLHVLPEEEVYQLKRVQSGNQGPLVYENIFLRKDIFYKIEDIDCTQAMNTVIHQAVGEHITNKNRMEVEATIANKKSATLLQVAIGEPLLRIVNIEIQDDVPLYAGVDTMVGDIFKFVVERDKVST